MIVGHLTLVFADDTGELNAKDITENFGCHIMSHPFIESVRAETGTFSKPEPEPIPGQMTVEEMLAESTA